MSIQLRHAVNAKRGASAAPFSWKWPASPAGGAPPAGGRRARPPAAPRAADKSGKQCARPEGGPAAGPGTRPRDTKGPACLGRRRAGGGDRGGACGRTKLRPPGLGPRPRASAAGGRVRQGVRGRAGAGRQRERVRRERQSGGWGPARRVPGIDSRGLAGLGLGRSRHHAGGSGRCPRCWRWAGPAGQERHGRRANCVPKATRPNRGPSGQLP